MYINLSTLRNIGQKIDVQDAHNIEKKQLFNAIPNKLDIKINIPTPLPQGKLP